MIHATSKIGAELDSLADAINFGVVPALILASVLLKGHDLGWAIVLVYCCAIILRLARFNTLNDDENAPGYYRDFFRRRARAGGRADRTGPRRFARGSGRRLVSSPRWSAVDAAGGVPCDQPHSDVVTKATTKLALCTGPGPDLGGGGRRAAGHLSVHADDVAHCRLPAHIPFAWWANRMGRGTSGALGPRRRSGGPTGA